MDKHIQTCLMIDYYGQLLTKKQYEVLDLYYNNDYSLAEISEITGISRQAVSDTKNKALDALLKYEEMLGLIKRKAAQQVTLAEICCTLKRIVGNTLSQDDRQALNKAEEMLGTLSREI